MVRAMARQMRAMVANGTGGPEVLELRQVPLTWPRAGHDVLVRLKAASALMPAGVVSTARVPSAAICLCSRRPPMRLSTASISPSAASTASRLAATAA